MMWLIPAAGAGAAAKSDARTALQAAEAALGAGPDATPSASEPREATLLLRDLALAVDELRGAERRRAERILARPTDKDDQFNDYFGPEAPRSPLCDPNFCVHWSNLPRHAPPPADADGNGVPDFAEQVLDAAAWSYRVENEALGWRRANSDGSRGARAGQGADGQVDIYLAGLAKDLFGYATPDPGERGRSRAGYLVLDNDYAGFNGNPVELMQVTLAHEYNHILQYGYDSYQDGWMFESTATWIEDHVYPDIDDYLNFVRDFAAAPFRPMAEVERKAFRLYGSAMWNHWLAERLSADTVREAWRVSPRVRPRDFAVAAYDRAIADAGGGSFSRQFADFAAATAEWNSIPLFRDAGSYPEVKRSGRIDRSWKRSKLDHTGYRLYRVKARGPVKLIAKVKPGTRSAIALIARDSAGDVEVASTYMARGGRASVILPDAGPYRRVTAAVINADGRVRGSSRTYIRDKRPVKARLR
jgi:hypothetical protein